MVVLFFSEPQPYSLQYVGINHADTAWMIVASALVLLMTAGLAFFMAVWSAKKMLFQQCFKALLRWVLLH